MTTNVAFIGCGYVADLYLKTFENWRETIRLVGVYDRDPKRLSQFGSHYDLKTYSSAEEMLAETEATIIVNLTNPDQHYDVSRLCLERGFHVYSEKPLAMKIDQARELIDLARVNDRHIVSAPATVLGEAAQTLWAAVARRDRGQPRLVYAELDDGMVHKIGYENWKTESGASWPAKDEFRTGCTIEHCGYALTWLVAMFGPARRVVSFAKLLIPDKGPHTPENLTTPDFTCAILEFDEGIIARITNSIVAPHDHRFRVFCDEGTLSVGEIWDVKSPVRSTPIATTRLRRQAKKILGLDFSQTLRPNRRRNVTTARRGYPMDFALGLADMADAISKKQTPRLSGEFSLHISEVSLAIQYPDLFGTEYIPKSSPQRIDPMPWAR